MNQIFTFNKNLNQRLNELNTVLCTADRSCTTDLKKMWSFYLELQIDPAGWQAIWKISRAFCENLNIRFPATVLVYVMNVDFPSHHAWVKVIDAEEPLNTTDKQFVPLIQLWPTKMQDTTVALNISQTAETVDLLRFFYLHLFMPWDLDDEGNNTSDWKLKHLESRLQLFYDMRSRSIPKAMCEKINSLMTEARRLDFKKNQIFEQIERSGEDEPNESEVDKLSDIMLQMTEIQHEVEKLENPLLRKAIIRRQRKQVGNDVNNKEPHTWLTCEKSDFSDLMKFMKKLEGFSPKEKIMFCNNLSWTLSNSALPNDAFFLGEGSYEVEGFGAMECGGTLRGLGRKDDTILVSTLEGIAFDFQGAFGNVENVTINATKSKYGFIVRTGKLTLSNCRIFGNSSLSTTEGFVVLSGAEINLINCEIVGFSQGIVAVSNAKIVLKNVEILDVDVGFRADQNCRIDFEGCTFRNCKENAIIIETDEDCLIPSVKGDFGLLQKFPTFVCNNLKGTNNKDSDVLIHSQFLVTPKEDLLSQDNLKDVDHNIPADESESKVINQSVWMSPTESHMSQFDDARDFSIITNISDMEVNVSSSNL